MPNDAALLEDIDADEQAYLDAGKGEPDETTDDPAESPPSETPAVETPAEPAKVDDKPVEKPAEVEAEKGDGKTVPLAVLLQERKDFQAKLDAALASSSKLDGRLEEINRRLAPEKPAEAEFEDPIAAIARLDREIKDRDARDAQRTQYDGFRNAVMASEQAFSATTPDYVPALNFMRDVRDRELSLVGIKDSSKRMEIIAQEAHALASNAMQAGESPAANLYALAKLRGYAAPAPIVVPTTQTAVPAAPAVDPADRLAALEKSVAASTSLSGATGTTRTELSLEALAAMSDEDFEKIDMKTIAKLHS